MPPLTRDEARHRAALIRPQGYRIDLDLTADGPYFTSTTTISFTASSGATTFVEVAPHRLLIAVLNGQDLNVDSWRDGRLPLPDLQPDNELVVTAAMAYSHDGEGLHRHIDPADGRRYLYAMSFLDAAPQWFACFDQPDLKAPYAMNVRCPADWTVVGNSHATRSAPGEWSFAETRPLATYFVTLVAGPYHSVSAEHDGIPLGLHARTSLADVMDRDSEEILTITRSSLDEFHRLFGIRYPFGEYHQVFVPEFNAGAMENPGCVTLRDTYLFRSRVTESEHTSRAITIAHEMAHMWFGDLVTMRWWDDLWLNESFAEYLGCRVVGDVTALQAWVAFGVLRKSWGYTADQRPSTHPVAGNGASDTGTALNDFDGISYAKGAAVLKQLAAHLRDDVFLAGLRAHFDAHAWGNAEFADLIDAWTHAGGTDVRDWAERWLRTSGVDRLAVEPDGGALRLTVTPPVGSSVHRPHAVWVAGYDAAGDETARLATRVEGTAGAGVRLPGIPSSSTLVLPDAADETWAKVDLPGTSWARMPQLLPGLDPMARVVTWNALRLAVSDAEVSPWLALEILRTALPREDSDTVIGSVLGWAVRRVAGQLLPEAHRSDAWRRLADACGAMLHSAAPASGRQLAVARALASVSSDHELLRSWLDGRQLPDGLEVDAELRWNVIARLCALGSYTEADIDVETGRDHTSQGVVHGATCRALLPTVEAKERAWQMITTDVDSANYLLYATAEGFWHPEQTGLTAPFVPRYFAEIPAMAAIRHGWVLARLAAGAYPATAVDPQTLQLTEQLLARPLDAGLRRSVIDAGDDLRRALAVRRGFAAPAGLAEGEM